MRFLVRLVMLLTVAVVVGGVAFLATWDIPPPTHHVEKTIPNDRFDP
tara:strand:+ start:5315 stop:5455 length:141 start_codon:yes stop_codon:yes gene_type:complete